jgi:hypothetical protein
MRAVLYPKCGPEAWATAEGVRPSPNIVQFKFRIWDLVNGGGVPPGKTIAYQVLSSDFAGHQDIVPKHGLVQETPIPEFAVGNAPGPHAANAPNELAESGSRNTGANAASAASSSGASGSSGFPTGWIVVVFILVALVAGFFGFAAPRVLARRRRSISQAPAREEVDQMAHAGVGLPDGGPSKSMTTSAAHTADASDAAGAVGPSERDPFAEGWPIDALNARQEGSSHPKPPEHREGEGPGVHAPDA